MTPTPTSTRVTDLKLTMSASPEPVQTGQILTYTQILTNLGPRLVLTASVSDAFPSEVTFVSCSIQGVGFASASCVGGQSFFTNFVGPGGQATITITTVVNAANGTITNTATASTSAIDSDPTNNTAIVTSTIGNGPTVTPTPTPAPSITPTLTVTPTLTTTPLASPLNFYSLTPCRVVDTRGPVGPYGGPSLAAGADRTFVFGGQCNIPPTVFAVALNVVAVQPTGGPGFLTLFPGGTVQPLVSTINYNVGKVRANNAIIPVGMLKDITVHCGQGTGTADVVIDVNGYFAP